MMQRGGQVVINLLANVKQKTIEPLIADFRGAKSAHIFHHNPQCFSRILLLFVSGFSFLLSWIVTLLFQYSHHIVEAQNALCAWYRCSGSVWPTGALRAGV